MGTRAAARGELLVPVNWDGLVRMACRLNDGTPESTARGRRIVLLASMGVTEANPDPRRPGAYTQLALADHAFAQIEAWTGGGIAAEARDARAEMASALAMARRAASPWEVARHDISFHMPERRPPQPGGPVLRKRKFLQLTTLTVGAALGLVGCATEPPGHQGELPSTPTRPETPGSGHPTPCSPMGIYGGTMYPATLSTTNGCKWADPAMQQYIQQWVRDFTVNGPLNMVRVTNVLEGHKAPDLSPGAKPLANQIDQQVWQNLDYLFRETQKYGVGVELDLSFFRNWLNRPGGDYSVVGYNPDLWNSFLEAIVKGYRDQPNLLYWSFNGEPLPPNESDGRLTTAALTDFYDRVSTRLHELDPHHLVSTGSLHHVDYDAGIDVDAILSLPHIGIGAVHIKVDNDQYIGLPRVMAACKKYGKYFMVSEIDRFQQPVATTEHPNPDADRARALGGLMTWLRRRGVWDTILWNAGHELNPGQSFDCGPQTPRMWATLKQYGLGHRMPRIPALMVSGVPCPGTPSASSSRVAERVAV